MPWITMPDLGSLPGLTARAKQAQPEQPRAWYSITNAAADEAELMIYDEIGGWFGALPDEFVADLNAITAPRIRLRLNSPGGSVFDGIAIANALRAHPATVTVQVDGIAASIASVIAMAGDRVIMQPQATLMIHDASGACLGNARDMADMAALLDKLSDNIADAYAEKAGGTREDWRERMRCESWYLASEAVAAGLADEVMPARAADGGDEDEEPMPGAPMMAAKWDLSVFRYAGREEAPAPQPTASATATGPASAPAPETASGGGGETAGTGTAAAQPAPAHPAIDVGALADALAAALTARQQPPAPLPEPEPDHGRTPEPDPWAATIAHLTQPGPDDWAAATAHLTQPSSAATAA